MIGLRLVATGMSSNRAAAAAERVAAEAAQRVVAQRVAARRARGGVARDGADLAGESGRTSPHVVFIR